MRCGFIVEIKLKASFYLLKEEKERVKVKILNLDDLYIALGLAMYRETLNDVNVELNHSIPGVKITTNIGELDFQAEMLIRGIWAKVDGKRQGELLRKVAEMTQERFNKQEETRMERKAAFEAE